MEKCSRLEEYSVFIATVRKYAVDKHIGLELAISKAIDECIEKNVLRDVLIDQRGAVMNYILESFDKEIYERDLRENIRNEVEAEVRDRAKVEITRGLAKRMFERGKSLDEIADNLDESIETIRILLEK